MNGEIKLSKGIFIISIDLELAWGYADEELAAEKKAAIRREPEAIKKLLELFDEFDIPATWAVVGHLLEKNCTWQNGRAHADFPRPVMAGEQRDWFAPHPAPGALDEDLWFDRRGSIDAVRQARAGHEIASHSYAHLLYGSKQTNPPALEKDLEKASAVHEAGRLERLTFIFPRNSAGRLDLLAKYGFICFRGLTRRWYDNLPGPLRKAGRLADYYWPAGITVRPQRSGGLVNIPDCLLLPLRLGARRLIAPRAVLRKARRSLKRAAVRREIFHLWFHPYNLVYEADKQLFILREICRTAAAMRERGEIEIMTMKETAKKVLINNSNLQINSNSS